MTPEQRDAAREEAFDLLVGIEDPYWRARDALFVIDAVLGVVEKVLRDSE